ncbi:MAG: nitronate monooxygenase [Clostridiales bacterium]|jgi:nitronate monooxygenase|nr:nitronate monooxygenase [Clostridiales bacterium]
MAYFEHEPLVIGDITVETPVVQGGMGVGISLSGLASAVANEGGLGVISAAMVGMACSGAATAQDNITALREEIRRAKKMTKGVLGVNIMVALSDFEELVKASVEEGIDVIFAGAGLPLQLPAFAGKTKTKLVPIVSSARAAKLITKWWREKYDRIPDAFVVEGPLAGGHLGFKKEQIDDPAYRLENLVVQVMEAVRPMEQEAGRKIPVIAAGGIFTGADIKRFFKLGVGAVQMATRFVATDECDADIAFKNAYVACKKEDIGIIQSPVGMPGRAIVNDFLRQAAQGEKHPQVCPFHCIISCKQKQSPYCISAALINAYRGKLDGGFAFVGANGWRVDEIVPVKKLFQTLAEEYRQAQD